MSDEDGDSLTLLEEYAYNLNPTVRDANPVDAGTGTSGLPNIRLVNGRLEIEFVARRSDPYLSYLPQFGNAPSESGLVPASQEITDSPISLQLERRVVVDSETTATQAARFARVKVTLTPP